MSYQFFLIIARFSVYYTNKSRKIQIKRTVVVIAVGVVESEVTAQVQDGEVEVTEGVGEEAIVVPVVVLGVTGVDVGTLVEVVVVSGVGGGP